MKKDIFAWLFGLMFFLLACRGPIKNPAALTPLPTFVPVKYPTATTIPSPTALQALIHQVQEGDTLLGISQQYNVDVQTIRALNGLQDSTIYVGQELKIPKLP